MGILKKGKEIIKIMQRADNFDLYREILDLSADLQNLARENLELKQKNEELTKQLTLKQKRKFKESSHLMDDDEISYIPRFLGG